MICCEVVERSQNVCVGGFFLFGSVEKFNWGLIQSNYLVPKTFVVTHITEAACSRDMHHTM